MDRSTINNAIRVYLAASHAPWLCPKAVLFDMDGVLFDSMRFHARAWKTVADRHHLLSAESDFYLYEGRTGTSTIDILYQNTYHRPATDEERKQIYEEKSALFRQLNDGEPMPGAADVLRKVGESGLQRLVVTGSGQRSLIDKLNHAYPHCFTPDKNVTAFDVKRGKPDPEPYLIGLKKAGVAPHEAIVIENAPLGVRAGVAAGIFTIAVNTGPLDDAVLLCEGAHLLLPSMNALAEAWEEIVKGVEHYCDIASKNGGRNGAGMKV